MDDDQATLIGLGRFLVGFSRLQYSLETATIALVGDGAEQQRQVSVLIAGERGSEIGRTWTCLRHLLIDLIDQRDDSDDLRPLLKALNKEAMDLIATRNDVAHSSWIYVDAADYTDGELLSLVASRMRAGGRESRTYYSPLELESLAEQANACGSTIHALSIFVGLRFAGPVSAHPTLDEHGRVR